MFQEVPNSYKEAMSSTDKDKWLAASTEEFEGLTEMGAWKLVDRPVNGKTIKCRWTYVFKSDGHYKARLVAKGYTQVQGIDYLFSSGEIQIYKISTHPCRTPRLGNRGNGCQIGIPAWSA